MKNFIKNGCRMLPLIFFATFSSIPTLAASGGHATQAKPRAQVVANTQADQQILSHIRDLDSEKYATRNAAMTTLRLLGAKALPLMNGARRVYRSEEQKQRLDQLIAAATPAVPARVRWLNVQWAYLLALKDSAHVIDLRTKLDVFLGAFTADEMAAWRDVEDQYEDAREKMGFDGLTFSAPQAMVKELTKKAQKISEERLALTAKVAERAGFKVTMVKAYLADQVPPKDDSYLILEMGQRRYRVIPGFGYVQIKRQDNNQVTLDASKLMGPTVLLPNDDPVSSLPAFQLDVELYGSPRRGGDYRLLMKLGKAEPTNDPMAVFQDAIAEAVPGLEQDDFWSEYRGVPRGLRHRNTTGKIPSLRP